MELASPIAGRNGPCRCGSGRKYKRCCGSVTDAAAQTLFRDGVDAWRAGRTLTAERMFSEVLRRQPRNSEALMMLGMLAGRSGRRAEAIVLLEQAIALGSHSAEARLLLANVHREAGEIGQAIAVLEGAVGIHPDDAALHSDLGLAYLQGQRVAEAITSLQRAIGLDPGLAAASYNLACALERERRYSEALAAYERAVTLAPRLAVAHSRMGNLLHAQGHREAALACFRRAAAAAPETTVGRLNQVKLHMEEERRDEAEAALRELITADPKSAEACRLLGNTLRETGRFDEAIIWLERAVAMDRTQIAAYHDLAYSKKLTIADLELVARMRARLADRDLNDHERTLLHFALGKGLDDLGEYAAAIEQFDAGNRLERRSTSFDRQAFAEQVDRLIDGFSPDFLAAHASLGNSDMTPVLILGLPRSGTTLVEQILSSHPRVAAGGELRYWNESSPPLVNAASPQLSPDAIAALTRDYLGVLRALSADAARVTDKMPFNFMWVGLIRLAFPRAAIIHCRRHPIDTCLSIYFTRFATRQDFAYDRDDLVFYYRQYRRLMDHWRRLLDPQSYLEIDYETLVDDRAAATRRLIGFVDLEWDDACLAPERNPRVVKTASLWQARQPVYRSSIERWRRYEPWLGALGALDVAALPASTMHDSTERLVT